MNDETTDPEAQGPKPVRVSAAKCVRCSQQVQPRFRPFCSQRCADIDLGSWFTGAYRVPTKEMPDSGDGEDENP